MPGLFEVPQRAGRASDSAIAKKANKKAAKSSTTVRGGGGLVSQIQTIKAMVEKNLGHLKDEYIVIQDAAILHNYLAVCIQNGIISIDTETTGLDPLRDTLVGISIYTTNMKAAYIPVHHKSYITGIEVDGQIPVADLTREFQILADAEIDIIMFNAAFDTRFLMSGINVRLDCTWDTSLASRLLNENEEHKNLKQLHQKYVLNGEGDAFRFDDLFKGVSFDLVPISVGYIYAAHDAIITYEYYEYQKPYLSTDCEQCVDRGLQDVAWVFHNIEMPCLPVIIDMENIGVDFDMEYNQVLHEKYHKLLDEKIESFYKVCSMYDNEIEAYRLKTPNSKLDDPINISSPVQLAILLYDIIGVKSPDEKKPRGTGEDILSKIDNPICKEILEYRTLEKLVSTYIDKLPDCVNPKDHRIHCKFNQIGADTGRMSSSDPNLQNIPSHNHDIRKMFKASEGYVMMSSDYSQQEPRALAALCRKDGDPQMYNTFMEGKDLYSEIASKAFGKPYEDCLEFRPDGTTNPDGKARRSQAKTILLGVLYGRGVQSIAEQLNTTTKKAQEIKDSVFRGFPAIKKFEHESIQMAQEVGFVTTVCGRKRRLPSMMLPDYEFKWKDGAPPDDDPLNFDDVDVETDVPMNRQNYYLRKLKQTPFKLKRRVFEEANEEGIWIIDHTRDKDTTKVVNARIQGSAADLTKLAMIELHENERLKELGFRILIPVHDEVIAECPEENAKECAKLLAETMSKAAERVLEMPIGCDVEVSKCWYGGRIEL